MNKNNELQHNLTLALHTITETNQSIRFADTKAGALAAVQALMLTVLAGNQRDFPSPIQALRVTCLVGVLVCFLLLAAGQAPRMFEHTGDLNRSSFPALARIHTDE